ncbi:hypothetical protein [Deinococcus sp. QL22]|uniref:DUF7694 domain-containing protein n=1 Tax=Deinococcus sp. QL22 TaxID=2939437 RepID=UPI002017DD6C|nr:hypothetical protein [Deinococcus sp. QL22]UQN09233.1 hypothetical protein M1R55_24705 [Deinococcus sp. QL22]
MPPASQWVNQHEFCLHLWQRLDAPLLPEGLHRSVGLRGGVPLDGMEKRLMQEGLPLFSLLRNLAR